MQRVSKWWSRLIIRACLIRTESIIDRYLFLVFPGTILIFDYSLTNHKLAVFWIILAGTACGGKGILKGKMRDLGVIGISMIILVWCVVVSVEKPTHWKNTFGTWLKIIWIKLSVYRFYNYDYKESTKKIADLSIQKHIKLSLEIIIFLFTLISLGIAIVLITIDQYMVDETLV